MTDLKDQLTRLLGDEPSAPDDIERIIGAGRRARRRRQAVIATAGTLAAPSATEIAWRSEARRTGFVRQPVTPGEGAQAWRLCS